MVIWRIAAQEEKLCFEPGEWSKWVVKESKLCSRPHYFPCGLCGLFRESWWGSLQAKSPLWFLLLVTKMGITSSCRVGTSGRASQNWWCGLLWAVECVPGVVHWSCGKGAEFALQGWRWIYSLICSDLREAGHKSILGVFKFLHCVGESCLEGFKPVLSCQQTLQPASRGRLWQTGAYLQCGAVELNDPRSIILDFPHRRGLAQWSPLSRQD